MTRRTATRVLVAACSIVACLQTAHAQYPSKPIRIVVPYPPGGQGDLIGRLIANHMSETLGQSVIVENRGGANTVIGMDLVANSPADGHTIGIGTTAMTINPALMAKLPFDTLRDFKPVTNLASLPFLLVIHPVVPAKTVGQLIDLARARPGNLTFGSGGAGSPSHLSGELLKQMAGVDIVHVPYKGLGNSIVGLMGGHIDLLFGGPLVVLPHAREGRLRAIGVTSLRRFPAAPDVPTLSESGLKGYESGIWFGVIAPAGVPAPVISRLNAEILKVLALPEVEARFEKINATVIGNSPSEFDAFIRAEMKKWATVARRLAK